MTCGTALRPCARPPGSTPSSSARCSATPGTSFTDDVYVLLFPEVAKAASEAAAAVVPRRTVSENEA